MQNLTTSITDTWSSAYARQYGLGLRQPCRLLTWHYPLVGIAKVSSETGVYLHLVERQPKWWEPA